MPVIVLIERACVEIRRNRSARGSSKHVDTVIKHRDREKLIDLHIGGRLRFLRLLLGFSQGRLARALGISCQQVQKYEAGINRLGASRLFDLNRILNVPVTFFFDDIPQDLIRPPVSRPQDSGCGVRQASAGMVRGDDGVSGAETFELVCAYYRINDPMVRSVMFNLIKSHGTAE